jgi:hypothetical protein
MQMPLLQPRKRGVGTLSQAATRTRLGAVTAWTIRRLGRHDGLDDTTARSHDGDVRRGSCSFFVAVRCGTLACGARLRLRSSLAGGCVAVRVGEASQSLPPTPPEANALRRDVWRRGRESSLPILSPPRARPAPVAYRHHLCRFYRARARTASASQRRACAAAAPARASKHGLSPVPAPGRARPFVAHPPRI